MTQPPLADAHGAGSESFGGPERFYLQHQAQIIEWYRLRSRATAAVTGWLENDVAPAMEAIVPDGWELVIGPEHRSGKHMASLVPPGAPWVDKIPGLSVALGWWDGTGSQTSSEPHPYVGVVINRKALPDLRNRLVGGDDAPESPFRVLRRANGNKGSNEWPFYRYIELTGAWWSDLDGQAEDLVAAVETVLSTFGDLVVDAVRATGTQTATGAPQ